MTHLRHWLIAAALLSSAHSSGLIAGSLDVTDATVKGGPANSSLTQREATGGRFGLFDVVLDSHAMQSRQQMDVGIGIDVLANGAMGWYGVYIQGLDRVPERNSIYRLMRETPRPVFNDGSALQAFCCTRSNAPNPPGENPGTITFRQASPTFYLYGMLKRKKFNLNFENGWTLHGGVRPMQYSSAFQTKVRFITVERYWDVFRTSYSFELERSSGVSVAPSHVLQIDYLYSPRDSIGVSVTNGREVAYFGSLGIQNTEVHSIAVRGQHWFKEDWAVTYQAGYNDHGSLPAQSGVRMGLRHSF